MSWQLSKGLGFLLFHSPIRKTTEVNIRKIYGIENTKELVKRYLYKISRYIFEVINLNKLKPKDLSLLKIEGFEKITQSLEKKHGCIILMMHAGNWELLGAVLGLKLPVNAVANTPDNNFFLQYLDNCRMHNHIKVINIQKENMYRGCLKALKNNELVIIAADTGATDSDKNIVTPFLGKLLPVASGWATLAKRTGAIVIPTFTYNECKYQHEALIGDPIDPVQYENAEKIIIKALNFYETNLKQHPDEWFLPVSDSEVKKTFK